MKKERKLKKGWVIWGLGMSLIMLVIAMELLTMVLLRLGAVDFSGLPYSLLEISSDSMYPAISIGDCVLLDKTPFEAVEVGDIICYESLGTLVTHRVVEVDEGHLVTKGDLNPVRDSAITADSYRGRVVRVIPELGRLFSLQRTPLGSFTLIALLTVVFFGKDFYLYLLERLDKKGKAEEEEPREDSSLRSE